jgi:ribosome-binding factor A
MGPESKQQLALRGLDNAKGFLQSRIADRIDTRYTPKLQFVVDQGVKKSLEVGKILEQLAAERQASEQGKSLGPDSLTDSDSIPDNERPESHRSEDELSDEAEIEIEEDSEESSEK